MKTAYSRVCWTVGLMGVGAAALAGEPQTAPPHEPVGFVAGGVIGAFAAGPIGAVVGAGLGTWLGNRVHRAGEATLAERRLTQLQNDSTRLENDKAALVTENAALASATGELTATNVALAAHLDQLSRSVDTALATRSGAAGGDAAKVLDGLQGDVLFRTGSADVAPEMAQGIKVLAEAVAKSPTLRVRVDGFADPRGTTDGNLKLSQARADAVRDLFLAAGVDGAALYVNAYGKSQSVAADSDGYALERRVRLTLEAAVGDAARAAQSTATGALAARDTR